MRQSKRRTLYRIIRVKMYRKNSLDIRRYRQKNIYKKKYEIIEIILFRGDKQFGERYAGSGIVITG